MGLPRFCMSQCWMSEAEFSHPLCEFFFPLLSSLSFLCCSLGLLLPIPTLGTSLSGGGLLFPMGKLDSPFP